VDGFERSLLLVKKILSCVKSLIPYPFRRFLLFLNLVLRNSGRWSSILLTKPSDREGIRVFYGNGRVPGSDEFVHGGMIKYQLLQKVFPNSPCHFTIQYMVSSATPRDWAQLLWLGHRKGARLVWNQNGVWYPACYGPDWEKVNKPMRRMLHAADYVFYQSQFCKLSADFFLGERQRPWEILYNPVDTSVFIPADSDPDPHHLILLTGGNRYPNYRFEYAARTIAILTRHRPNVRLLVIGQQGWAPDGKTVSVVKRMVANLGIADRVIFLGSYLYKNAPTIFRKAHLLLHTQYNDACPGLVIEAMACGIPVVYSRSGGVPELVGDEAGIGIPAELSWDHEIPPDPQAMAEAILRVDERRAQYAEAARQRAMKYFDVQPWLRRHHEIFEELLSK
jgi:glycosyltransferase involved in cell wall biosynthesis